MIQQITSYENALAAITGKLSHNSGITLSLPSEGLLKFDRPLPFLCIYRKQGNRQEIGTEKFVTSQSAYLVVTHSDQQVKQLTDLCNAIGETLYNRFGVFIFIELWSSNDLNIDESASTATNHLSPQFKIVSTKKGAPTVALETLKTALSTININSQKAQVTEVQQNAPVPPKLNPLYTQVEEERCTCQHLGLEISPIYWDKKNGQIYPVLLSELVRQVTRALRETIFSYISRDSEHFKFKHFDAIGPNELDEITFSADKTLQKVDDSFDFLMQVTPVNAGTAWEEFKKNKYKCESKLYYRPLTFHPDILKRELYDIPVERIHDPTLSHLLREKRDELDLQIAMLINRDSAKFFYGSLQLYGGVDDSLFNMARDILQTTADKNNKNDKATQISATEFLEYAHQDINYYKQISADFNVQIKVRNDIASDLMVSEGNLLIGEHSSIPEKRIHPLLQHEVGTHLVTYYNGKAQPFQQLKIGLAGSEALQEGLAVFAEYLVGGLTCNRIRTIAARVVAVQALIEGQSFIQTFSLLVEQYDFAARFAFNITLRVYRGGGFTKDAVYLRGIHDLMVYLGNGGELEVLFMGKIALHHAPMIKELQHREILLPPVFWPRYLENSQTKQRLQAIRSGNINLLKICEEC